MSIWAFFISIGLAMIALMLLFVLIYRANMPGSALIKKIADKIRYDESIQAIWQSLQNIITLLSTRKVNLYDPYWCLVLGQSHSGRSDIVHALGPDSKSHHLLKIFDKIQQRDNWRVLDQGVLIDAQYAGENEKYLAQVLRQVNQLRPARPIDGILLTIDAEFLLDYSNGDRKQRIDQEAKKLFKLLWTVQKQSAFILPVYILITKTDLVPGYRQFWREFPELQQQVFGWSCPDNPETQFQADWVSRGFADISQQLYTLQAAALSDIDKERQKTELDATESEKQQLEFSRDFVLFPERLKLMQENLYLLLKNVFDKTIYDHGASVRGFYFTGSLNGQDKIGLDELVRQKIFARRDLARPLRESIWSRNSTIKTFQISSLALLFVFTLTVISSFKELSAQVQIQKEALRTLNIETASLKQNSSGHMQAGDLLCQSVDHYFGLVGSIAHIKDDIVFWNIPYSWISLYSPVYRAGRGQDGLLSYVAEKAFGDIIFPSLECLLSERAKKIAANLETAASHVGGISEQDFSRHLAEIYAFEKHRSLYNRVTGYAGSEYKGAMKSAFYQLTYYLYGRALPDKVINGDSALVSALLKVEFAEPCHAGINTEKCKTRERTWLDYEAAVGQGLERMVDERMDDLLAVVEASQEVFNTQTVGKNTAINRAEQLDSWIETFEQVFIDGSENGNACDQIKLEMKYLADNLSAFNQNLNIDFPHRKEVNKSLRKESIDRTLALIAEKANAFDPQACLQKLLTRMQQVNLLGADPVVSVDGSTIRWSEDFQAELTGIKLLLKEPFAKTTITTSQECDYNAALGNKNIEQALVSLQQYQKYQSVETIKLGSQASIVENLAQKSVEDAVAQALFSSFTKVEGSTVLQQVNRLSDRYGKTVDNLIFLVTLYNQLGLQAKETEWFKCINKVASSQLSEIYLLYQQSNLYMPSLESGSDGNIYKNTGKTALIEVFLANQEKAAAPLINAARPYVHWFAKAASETAYAENYDNSFWKNTISAYDDYATNNMQQGAVLNLRDYFVNQLDNLNYDNCSEKLAKPLYTGYDLFSQRTNSLYLEAKEQCTNHVGQYIVEDYKPMAQDFNQYLAGQFPFANASAEDLAPEVWLNFIAKHQEGIAALKKALEALEADRWNVIKPFVTQLADAMESINPMFLSGAASPLKLNVDFKQQAHNSPGADQIVTWSLATSSNRISFPNAGDEIEWAVGDSIQLGLDWADFSDYIPTRDPDNQTMSVTETTARFTYRGPWALLRYIQANNLKTSPDPSRVNLQFDIPVTAKTKGKSAKNPKVKLAPYHAKAHISISFSAKAEDSQAWEPWVLADKFPQDAPKIW